MTTATTIRGGRHRAPDGSRIAYLTAGEGPVLLFLHASMGTGMDLTGVAQRFAADHRLVLVDRRGHGASDWGVGPYGVDREVEDLLSLLDHWGPATVVGHSYGATVALETALVAPAGLVERLALYEPPLPVEGPLGAHVLPGCVADLDAGEYERALIDLLSAVGLLPHAVDALRTQLSGWAPLVREAPAFVREILAVNALGPGVDRYRALTVPTLLMSGQYGPDHLRRGAAALAAALRVPLETLPGHDHTAPISGAAEVAGRIARFITGDGAAA